MSIFHRAANAIIRANETNLPPPSRGMRTYDYNETLVLFRNRERYMPRYMLTPPSPSSPSPEASGGSFSGDLK